MDYPSDSIRRVVEELAKLPGIGKKTALRLALHLLRTAPEDNDRLGQAIQDLRRNTQLCTQCGNLSDGVRCRICCDTHRQTDVLCIVADVRDVMALERTHQYNGQYHVLGGVINPLAGIGPGQLNIESLSERAKDVKEIILALPATPEGETTAFFIAKKLNGFSLKITNIARGIPVGSELEFADELTLARSIQQRTDYHHPLTAHSSN
jgi:recombination protein RecR